MERKILTRREFLYKSAILASGMGISVTYGCGDSDLPVTTLPKTPNTESNVVYSVTEVEVKSVVAEAVENQNRFYGFNMLGDKIVRNTVFLDSETEAESVCREEPGTTLNQCKDRLAFVNTTKKKIFFLRSGFEKDISVFKMDPNLEIIRQQYLGLVLNHEIVHLNVASSPVDKEFSDIVFREFFKKDIVIDVSKVTNIVFTGAVFKFDYEGQPRSGFVNLEEAEADVISKLVFKDSRNATESINLGPFSVHEELLNRLMTALGKFESSVKMLAKSRTVAGGREKFIEHIGNYFGSSSDDAISYGLKILISIEQGDQAKFEELTQLK